MSRDIIRFTIYYILSQYIRDTTIRPVLKHGPRSSTGLQVVEFLHKALFFTAKRKQNCVMYIVTDILQHRLITYMRMNWVPAYIKIYSSWIYFKLIKLKSTLVETRKMVNYAWTWWSQVKTWWKLALCGTDVQIVAAWPRYRGERLIEPSSSWFPPKFPLG